MKKVLIRGCIGNKNFGDDLLIYAISLVMRQVSDKCDCYFLADNVKYLDNIVDDIKIIEPFKLKGKFDVIIYAGGTQFASFKNKTARRFPSIKRVLHLIVSPSLFWFKLLNKLGFSTFSYEKIFFVGIGIGPFYKKDNYYNSVIKLLQSTEVLIVRDFLSCKICEENNIKCILGSDLVYTIPLNFWDKYKNDKLRNSKITSVAIIFRDWKFTDDDGKFVHSIKELTKYYDITFFSFADYADQECYKYLVTNNFNIKQWAPNTMSLNSFMNELQKCDLFITARYHGAVVATLMNKPFITIGIEPKLKMIAKLFEMPCWHYPYNISECVEYVKKIQDEYTQIQEQLELIVSKEHKKANEMVERIYENILNT